MKKPVSDKLPVNKQMKRGLLADAGVRTVGSAIKEVRHLAYRAEKALEDDSLSKYADPSVRIQRLKERFEVIWDSFRKIRTICNEVVE